MLAGHGLKRGWLRVVAPLVWLFSRPGAAPTRLLIAPQDIRTGDPTVASDIYAGYFAFGGKVVNAHGRSPFDIEPPQESWAETLHGFAWLRHLRAADTALARANARALVEDWMGRSRRSVDPVARQPRVVARRVLSWLSQSPVILDGADGAFYRRLMRSLGRQAGFLQRALHAGLDGESRLWAALALAELGICADAPAANKRVSRLFVDEISRQILGDGGHISRNPAVLTDLLLDLLPLRQAYAARGAEVPPTLLNAIDRMMPMLRMFRHPDGSLALFNGMGVTQPESLATVLAYDDARAIPLSNAPYSGYQRVEAGTAVLICDTGRPPPLAFSKQAHAGTLSFEFSTGVQRLVVNCGMPDARRGVLHLPARSTAAHSALVLADMSSGRFLSSKHLVRDLDGALVEGPGSVRVHRRSAGGKVEIDAEHDGYARLGYVHHRGWRLSEAGTELRGEDRLVDAAAPVASAPQDFALRFHLHPAARPTFAEDGRSISILLPNEERWLFEAGDLPADIEESVFFASAEGPRRTEQIVVQANTADVRTVAWSFVRQ